MLLYTANSCWPAKVIAAIQTTEISAAIRPYSIAVTPDSSLTKRETRVCIEKILFVVCCQVQMAVLKDNIVETVNILKATTKSIRPNGLAAKRNSLNGLMTFQQTLQQRVEFAHAPCSFSPGRYFCDVNHAFQHRGFWRQVGDHQTVIAGGGDRNIERNASNRLQL